MIPARVFALTVVAFAVSCTRTRPAADSAATLPAPDTVKAAPEAVPDSMKIMKQADTKGAATKGTPSGVKAPDSVTTKTTSKQPILGRDSVRQGPIIGIPAISDTAKRRPPG